MNIDEKHYIDKYTRYTFNLRNGKDCYIWFELRDYWGETKFTSAKHKISLNQYRLINVIKFMRSKGVRI